MPPEDFKAIQAEAEEGAGFSIDDYFQLDYEDIIGGDLPTRFKYRKVEAKDYGIPANVILAKSGKELNQMVSLKKLRTYRDENVGDEDDAWAHSRKGRGKGKGQGKSKGRGRGQEPARQGKKKGSEAAQGSELSAARLEAYNLQGDKFAREKHWPSERRRQTDLLFHKGLLLPARDWPSLLRANPALPVHFQLGQRTHQEDQLR